MLVRDVFLDERRSLEELLTGLAAEFTLVFLLDVGLAGSRKLPVPESTEMARHGYNEADVLLIALAAVVSRIDSIAVNEQRNLGVEPFKPALVYVRLE